VATVFRLPGGAMLSAKLFFACLLFPPTLWLVSAADSLVTILPYLPHLILSYVAAGGFAYYLREGRVPNIYFRRRVRV
jgi:hypothetical protein